MTAKQEVQSLLSRLPDGCSLEDIQYHLYVLEKVHRGLEDALATIMGDRKGKPIVVSTCARKREKVVTYAEMRQRMTDEEGPFVLVFGTGYGLAEEVLESSDAVLEPIGDPGDWNHLSVRAAVAIILDRLLGG